MALKKIMFATLLLLTIITIGAVSASEDIAGDNVVHQKILLVIMLRPLNRLVSKQFKQSMK
ncbi:hypothetical protein [uncultured Methanobrevibacter sp.]|uniref:hypothetical protein n=1 Tax=uncultured Methanobrevibacter sp. TaxID=253161 RepID=UPI0025DA3EA7|nr:hypothetical protein [uncultured Methanobrevibacter sp.]